MSRTEISRTHSHIQILEQLWDKARKEVKIKPSDQAARLTMAHRKQISGSGSRSPEKCAKKLDQAREWHRSGCDLWQQPLS